MGNTRDPLLLQGRAPKLAIRYRMEERNIRETLDFKMTCKRPNGEDCETVGLHGMCERIDGTHIDITTDHDNC